MSIVDEHWEQRMKREANGGDIDLRPIPGYSLSSLYDLYLEWRAQGASDHEIHSQFQALVEQARSFGDVFGSDEEIFTLIWEYIEDQMSIEHQKALTEQMGESFWQEKAGALT